MEQAIGDINLEMLKELSEWKRKRSESHDEKVDESLCG